MATSTSSISGLISGLDTKTLISQLIAVAAQPQTQLKTELTSTNAQNAAAQSINAKAASMTSLAKDLADTKTYTTATASSSDSSVSAAASSTAGSGSVSFYVTAVAHAESQLTGVLSPTGATGFQFQLTRPGDSSPTTITADTDSAADIAKAINAFAGTDGTDAGVTATVVGTGSSQRLQVTADKTGTASTFTLFGLPTTDPATLLEAGSNAEIAFTGVSGNAQSDVRVSSATNTFTGVMTGVDVTVSKVDLSKVVTVSTAVSSSAISSKVSGLVTAMNAVLADVAFHTKQPGTGVTASATNGGLLAGQASFRDLSGSILDTISASVGSTAAVKAGLSVGRDGTVSFDSSTFATLYKSDPATAQKVLTAFASAVQTVGKNASDPVSGAVTGFITGGTSTAKTLTDRIADWDIRLDAKQTRLTAQYAALETALQKLKSQSDSLTSALASLTSNNS